MDYGYSGGGRYTSRWDSVAVLGVHPSFPTDHALLNLLYEDLPLYVRFTSNKKAPASGLSYTHRRFDLPHTALCAENAAANQTNMNARAFSTSESRASRQNLGDNASKNPGENP